MFVKISRSRQKRPQFSALHYATQISEKTSVGATVYSLSAAIDGDTEAQIAYSIHGSGGPATEKFRVETR